MKTAGSISSFVFALVIASACAQSAPEPFFEGLGSYTRKVSTDSPEAQKYFEQFTHEYPASPFVPEALFGIASCLDAKKKPADAIAKFEELRRRYGKSSVMDETKLALGRLYEEQNKPAMALDLYDELVKANQYSGIGSEAGLRMEDLLNQHPELKKTNAPIMMPPPATRPTNLAVRMTNRPQITMTNLTRRTSAAPSMIFTNRPSTTGGPAPLKLNISTNKQ